MRAITWVKTLRARNLTHLEEERREVNKQKWERESLSDEQERGDGGDEGESDVWMEDNATMENAFSYIITVCKEEIR